MDQRVRRLEPPESCERFAKNAEDRGHPKLAREARRRATEIRAAQHRTESEVEREALQAIYAYEEILTKINGKRTRASRTWRMIDRHGVLHAVERAVNRESDPIGYSALVEMGMTDLAFEAIVLRHPDTFSSETVERARQRLHGWNDV